MMAVERECVNECVVVCRVTGEGLLTECDGSLSRSAKP